MSEWSKRWVIVSNGEGAQACVLSGTDLHESVHRFMCFCGKPWRECECGREMIQDIELIDDPSAWTLDENGEQFSVCWPHETGRITLYRLSQERIVLEKAEKMWDLIRDFVMNETSQTSYAELKDSQSMDIPVEFLALCEFAEEEMGVKLP
jgi:hypothetical protein